MLDYIEIDYDFVLVETGVPEAVRGKSLAEAQLRNLERGEKATIRVQRL